MLTDTNKYANTVNGKLCTVQDRPHQHKFPIGLTHFLYNTKKHFQYVNNYTVPLKLLV